MRLGIGIVLASLLALPAARAEQALVLRDGTVVKCQKYEVKGNVYVLTMPNGKLQSMRADKVDAEATKTYDQRLKDLAEAEAQRKAAGEAAKAEPAAPAKGEPAKTLTNEDLAKFKGRGGMGDETSVSAEGGEMPSRADYEKMEKGGDPPVDKDVEKYGTISNPTAEGEALWKGLDGGSESKSDAGSEAPPEE